MAFTTRTITHTFEAADGSGASGTITFALTKRMTNGTTTIVPSEITATLTNGALSQALTSNQDSGTVPQDSQWRVDFRISTNGAPLTETYYITVPPGPGSTDLGSLLPQQPIGG